MFQGAPPNFGGGGRPPHFSSNPYERNGPADFPPHMSNGARLPTSLPPHGIRPDNFMGINVVHNGPGD